MIKVNHLHHLKTLLKNDGVEFAVMLRGGALRNKHLYEQSGDFWVLDTINGTEWLFTETDFFKTTVGQALREGALYCSENE